MTAHRRALILFGIALAVVIAIAFLTTWDQETRIASNEAPAGTTGLARQHQPLDRAPGEAIPNHRQ
jgi:hypothetical protein